LTGGRDNVVPVDQDPYLALDDVAEYVRHRLLLDDAPATRAPWRSPYVGDDAIATRVARAVAVRSGGNFLVAQLTSRNLAEADERVDLSQPRWWADFPTDVDGAMDGYLARFGEERDQRRIREALTPLAFAVGEGLPLNELWASAASALSFPWRYYTVSEVERVLEEAATYLLVAARHGRRTYQLFHDALGQYLRRRCKREQPEQLLVRSWRDLVSVAADGRPDWAAADPYLRSHLAQHAAEAGELDAMLADARFVVTAEPMGLIPALGRAGSDDARRVARAYQRIPVAAMNPADRAAYLTLSAQQLGDERVREAFLRCGLPLPWSVTGGDWNMPHDYRVLERLDDSTTATMLVTARRGSATIVSGDRSGLVHIREFVGGILDTARGHPGHEAPVTALGGTELPDGRLLLCSGAADGTVRPWHVDAGLLIPFGPAIRQHGVEIIDLDIVLTRAGVALVSCDSAGAVSVAWVPDDGTVQTHSAGSTPGLGCLAFISDHADVAAVGGTVDGAAVLLRPDGHGGLRVTTTRIARFSVFAVATTGTARRAWVAFGTGKGDLHLYQWHGDALAGVAEPAAVGHFGIHSLAFVAAEHPGPHGLLIGDNSGTVQVWAVDDGALASQQRSRVHEDEVTALAVVRDGDGDKGISCGRDRRIVVWPLGASHDDDSEPPPDIDIVGASSGVGSASLVLREGGDVQRWVLGTDDRLQQLPEAASATRDDPRMQRVRFTTDGRGSRYVFRVGADAPAHDSAPSEAPRTVELHPHRAFAVADIGDGPVAGTLQSDGSLKIYDYDDPTRPTIEVATGIEVPISMSFGRAAGVPVVVCGDVDGMVRVCRWADIGDWADVQAWSLGQADIRAAAADDRWGRSLLLTGDAIGCARALAPGRPAAEPARRARHRTKFRSRPLPSRVTTPGASRSAETAVAPSSLPTSTYRAWSRCRAAASRWDRRCSPSPRWHPHARWSGAVRVP
jgi:WD40 repeat protein